MHIAHEVQFPELEKLIEAMKLRRDFFGLKGKLLRGVEKELIAARAGGLTWRAIWEALRKEGFTCGYPQFCRTAKRLVQGQGVAPYMGRSKNLPPPQGEKVREQAAVADAGPEKPAWQRQREDAMAKLDREAELNREREARMKPEKVFRPSTFRGRGEE